MKKTRSMLAMLMCLAMLVTLLAVNVSAAGNVSHEVNFIGMDLAAAGDATKAAMEAQGLTVPEDSGAWEIVDHFAHVLTPKDGHSKCSYIQTLEAPEGEVFNGDANLFIYYALAAKNLDTGEPLEKVGELVVYVSDNGQDWTECWANREGQGKMYDSTAIAQNNVALTGTNGKSKVYVKVELTRYDGVTAGMIGTSRLSASTKGTNEVVTSIDARNATGLIGGWLHGDAAVAEIERLGFTVEGENPWSFNDCYHVFLTPKDGFQQCHLIQTIEAGKGKVFAKDVYAAVGYWLAMGGAKNDECETPEFVIEVSTDGETWTNVLTDDEGRAPEYDQAAFVEDKITLTGTAGASKVYVRYSVTRYGGPTAGGLTYSTLAGDVKADPNASKPDPENPKSGDTISVVLAMAMVCAAGAVITTKKFRKEN